MAGWWDRTKAAAKRNRVLTGALTGAGAGGAGGAVLGGIGAVPGAIIGAITGAWIAKKHGEEKREQEKVDLK